MEGYTKERRPLPAGFGPRPSRLNSAPASPTVPGRALLKGGFISCHFLITFCSYIGFLKGKVFSVHTPLPLLRTLSTHLCVCVRAKLLNYVRLFVTQRL